MEGRSWLVGPLNQSGALRYVGLRTRVCTMVGTTGSYARIQALQQTGAKTMPNNAGNLKNLYLYFGWQGGTIHQIAEETGCNPEELIYTVPDQMQTIRLDSDYSLGQSALATCSKGFRVNVLAPKYRGNLMFWLGVRNGYAVM